MNQSHAPQAAEQALPSYGKLPFHQLGQDVVEAMMGVRQPFDFGPNYPGHAMCLINFNSLARIVDKYRLPEASAPVAGEAHTQAKEHFEEVRATLQGAHRIMEGLSAIERRVGPVGSHARGYTHKITSALRHLDMLYAARQASEAVPIHKLAVAALNDLLIDIRAELGLGTTEEGRAILGTIRALKTQADKDGVGSKEHQ